MAKLKGLGRGLDALLAGSDEISAGASLQSLPLARNSDDFVFDNQMLSQAIYKGYRIGEISCPTKYFPEASSINFRRSVIYGSGCVRTSISFRLARLGFANRYHARLASKGDRFGRLAADPTSRFYNLLQTGLEEALA